ncbi:glycerol-3-phosphate dehydrogenase (NAD(P)+) [Actinacidiphila rubida]|uniref:Glycerol-3-phosphate dehydrogenase (NAD(P)+) n=1 Tax=Actinacidiphila rubida TaxID=310780 RepID=A0A1H8S3G0_9ACTN|nr:glycerol-3-phosphate dehydrogenase (NAD(P)+) [Actinacidiphila rubida]
MTGCGLGGAVKSVIALAVGIASGMRLGDNTKAMLIARGLYDIHRLGMFFTASPRHADVLLIPRAL